MAAPAPSYKYTILAVGVGNALEWYDFAIFGALADVFGKHYFPLQSSGAQLMAAFSVYCSAFFMRPFGGLLFGHIGDTYGRKQALEISIGLMILVSFLIGVLPTYEMIGYSATALVVVCRMVQGVAVGGEMVGAYIYTVEGCDDGWIAFWSGVCKSTGLFGTVLGMGLVALLRGYLQEGQFYRWGWRVPFLASLIMGGLGVYLRSFLKESQEFVKNVATSSGNLNNPTTGKSETAEAKKSHVQVWNAFVFHWPEIISVGLVVSFWATGFYTSFIWMAYYTSQLMADGESVPHAWLINTIMLGVFVIMLPCMGAVADRYSHKLQQCPDVAYRKCMMVGSLGVVLLACPVFYLVNLKAVWSVFAGYAILSLCLALFGCCLPAVMVKQFTVQYRYTAMGIAYNVANAIFAGTAPLLQTSLVLHARTPYVLVNTSVIPAVSLMAVGLLSAASLAWGPAACQYVRIELKMSNWSNSTGGSVLSEINMSASGSGGGDIDNSISSQSSERSILDTSRTPMIKYR